MIKIRDDGRGYTAIMSARTNSYLRKVPNVGSAKSTGRPLQIKDTIKMDFKKKKLQYYPEL